MASTVTLDSSGGRAASFPRKTRRGLVNLGTYATGGVTVTNKQLELYHSVEDFDVRPSGGYVFEALKTSSVLWTVKAYRQKDPAAAGGADIPLPEVANAVDISAITARFRAEGR